MKRAERRQFIVDYYESKGLEWCADQLGITTHAARNVAWRAGVLRKRKLKNAVGYSKVSDEEVALLKRYYPQIGPAGVAEMLGRSETRIRQLAYEYDVSYQRPDEIPWSAEEEKIISQHLEDGAGLMAALRGLHGGDLPRSANSIKLKLKRMRKAAGLGG